MSDNLEINLKEHKIFFVGGEDYLVNNKTDFSLQNFPVSKIDLIKNQSDILELIKDYRPDFVVHAVAYPSVDFCESNDAK